MGDYEAVTLVAVESSLKYHPYKVKDLTLIRNPGRRQCLMGSLTGVVASQTVTEAFKGSLKVYRNHLKSAKA